MATRTSGVHKRYVIPFTEEQLYWVQEVKSVKQKSHYITQAARFIIFPGVATGIRKIHH